MLQILVHRNMTEIPVNALINTVETRRDLLNGIIDEFGVFHDCLNLVDHKHLFKKVYALSNMPRAIIMRAMLNFWVKYAFSFSSHSFAMSMLSFNGINIINYLGNHKFKYFWYI